MHGQEICEHSYIFSYFLLHARHVITEVHINYTCTDGLMEMVTFLPVFLLCHHGSAFQKTTYEFFIHSTLE